MPADQLEAAAAAIPASAVTNEEDEVPTLEVADMLQHAGQTKNHSKETSKMGLKPAHDIVKVKIRKHGAVAFAVDHPEVYQIPGTNTYVFYGEPHLRGSVMDTQDAAARAVSGIGTNLVFEEFAASKAMEARTLRHEADRSPHKSPSKSPQQNAAKSLQVSPMRLSNGSNSRCQSLSRSPRQGRGGSSPGKNKKQKNHSKSQSNTPSKSSRHHTGKNLPSKSKKQKKRSKSKSQSPSTSPQHSAMKSPQSNGKNTHSRSKSEPLPQQKSLSKSLQPKSRKTTQTVGNREVKGGKFRSQTTGKTSRKVVVPIRPLSFDDGEGEEEDNEFDDRDIRVVIKMTGATLGTAIRSLRRNKGDLVDTILEITIG